MDKDIIAIDSTTISVGKGRLKWAKYKSHKAGIKLHVAFNVNSNQPQQVKETNANKHDGPVGEEIIDIENMIELMPITKDLIRLTRKDNLLL